jgi:ATP-dependent Lon protease
VLPVGGIKEKVLAAKRAGLKRVILPERNRKDLEDVPANVKQDLEFDFIKRVDDVIDLAINPESGGMVLPPPEQVIQPEKFVTEHSAEEPVN